MNARLIEIDIDDTNLALPTPEIEQERKVAIFDLLEENFFALPGGADADQTAGPFRLQLGVRDRRLFFDVTNEANVRVAEVFVSLSPFRQVVKDYHQICESYFDAVKRLPASQIEVIDTARRGIHDEGGRLLHERLEGKIEVDRPTARRLFTLICVLRFGG
ncbi:MAG: hypothetical protein ACI853_001351 [Paracoccaceae bacterium]|jgi:uncharacterized protein (UPF0262 family)